jgi:hypothetical protein
MLSIEDVFSVILFCVTIMASVALVANVFDKRHKRELEFEKKRFESDTETALMKARIYADKDLKIANMENSLFNDIPDAVVPEGIEQYLPLIQAAMQNPEQIKTLLNSVTGGNNGKT